MNERLGGTVRVYSPNYGDMSTVVVEREYETAEDQKKFWADFEAQQPISAELWEKYHEMLETGYFSESLTLH